MKKNKCSINILCGAIKWPNIHVIGVPKRGETEYGTEKISEEIIAQNFSS